MSGSLERLLASVDAELPRHLRRLAAAPGFPRSGRGVRVGVFPAHIVVEWRAAGGMPEHFALAWRRAGTDFVFGDVLMPLESLTEQLGSWTEPVPSTRQETDDPIEKRLEQLEQRLREITADRSQPIAEADRAPTSVMRRHVAKHRVADDVFVRAVRRR